MDAAAMHWARRRADRLHCTPLTNRVAEVFFLPAGKRGEEMQDELDVTGGFWQRYREQYAALKARVLSLTELFIVEHIWDCCTGGPVKYEWIERDDAKLIEVGRGVSRQAVSKALKRIRKLGWISRRRSRRDGRSWEYTVHPDKFSTGPVWAARTCRPREESVNLTLHNPQAECTHPADCPYYLNKIKNETSSSSSVSPVPTTTEVLNVLPPNPSAGNSRETHSDAGPTGNSRDRRRARRSASAEARPGSRAERLGIRGRRDKSADAPLPNPDAAGPDAAPVPAQNKQNTAVLRAADVCPVVVAEAVAEAMPGCDQHILDTMYQRCVAAQPDITPDEVVQFVREVAPRARASRTARSLPAVFRQSMVSAVGTPSDVERIRRMLAAEARRQEQQRIETERFIQEQLADPDVPEAEKRQLIEWVEQLRSKGKPPT